MADQKITPPLLPQGHKPDSPFIVKPWYLIVALGFFTCLPPLSLPIGLAFYYFAHYSGYWLWMPWLIIFYCDYTTSRNGKYNKYLRFASALCAASSAAFLTEKLLEIDVWQDDPDYRGGLGIIWFMNLAALFAVYAMVNLSANFSPSHAPRTSKASRAIVLPIAFLLIFISLIAAALCISAVNSPLDYGMESLFMVSAGVTSICAILNGRRICFRAPLPLMIHGLLFAASLAGVWISHCYAELHWFASSKPFYILLSSSVFSGLTLSASFLRSAKRQIMTNHDSAGMTEIPPG